MLFSMGDFCPFFRATHTDFVNYAQNTKQIIAHFADVGNNRQGAVRFVKFQEWSDSIYDA